MKHFSKVYAIIPARGGSKGLKNKNIKELAGKSLIEYSIEAALKCSYISRVIVSTEDLKIKQISQNCGAEVFDRPFELASDTAKTSDVVLHVLEKFQQENDCPEYIALLQPTSPMRTSDHLLSCIEAFFESDSACAISVTESEDHPYKSFIIENEILEPLFDIKYLESPRQTLPKTFRPNGAIFLISSELFLEKKVFYVSPAMPFYMSNETSVDIDTEFDFFMVESMLKQLKYN